MYLMDRDVRRQVMFPQRGFTVHGTFRCTWLPPGIWKFTRHGWRRERPTAGEWFKGTTRLTECANDITVYLGPDGYLLDRHFAEQARPLGNGRVLKDKAAHIHRAADGSNLR